MSAYTGQNKLQALEYLAESRYLLFVSQPVQHVLGSDNIDYK